MFHRGFRGSRRRSTSGPKAIIQSFKKQLLFADASFGVGFRDQQFITGFDSITAGQTSATDAGVPTGSSVKFVEIQAAMQNPTDNPLYINCSIQYILNSQSYVDPDVIGGHKQRNQVFHTELYSIGQGQNSTHKFRFKIPKGFQRIKDGTKWALVWNNTVASNAKFQIIYKFYR